MYDHQCNDQQISIDWQYNLWHCSIWNIYLIHFVNLQCGSEKNTAQSRAVIISHTQRFANQQYSTILTISCSTLVNFQQPYKPNSNFLHSYHRTNSFWCNRKTTILTELLPPSLTHILHHFCWFINLLIVENFFLDSQSSFCILVTPSHQ